MSIWAFTLVHIKLMPMHDVCLTETFLFLWFQDDSKTTCENGFYNIYLSKHKTNDTLKEFWQRYIHIVVLDANVTVTVTVNAINH